MKKIIILMFICAVAMSGCAGWDEYKASDARAMVDVSKDNGDTVTGDDFDNINDNFTELSGKWTALDAINGIVEVDGAGTPSAITTVAGIETVTSEDIITSDEVEDTAQDDVTDKPVSSNFAYDLQQYVLSLSSTDSNTQMFEGVTPEALPTGSTPQVEAGHLYYVYDVSSTTLVDNLVDSDGDHSEFSVGDFVGILLADSDWTIDFADNENLEGNANTPFTGHDSQLFLMILQFSQRPSDLSYYWQALNPTTGMSNPLVLSISDGNIGTGTWQAGKKVFSLSSSTDLDLATYGDSEVYITADEGTFGLWDCSSTTIGTGVRLGVIGAIAVYVDAFEDPTNDFFELISGAVTDAGDGVDLADEAGNEFYQFRCRAANTWSVIEEINIAAGSENATDGGAAAACDSCPGMGSGVTFCYDGEHASGSDYATAVSGNIQATTSGTPAIHGDYAQCGDYGVQMDGLEYVRFAVVDGTDHDMGAGYIEMDLKFPSGFTGTTSIIRKYTDNDHRLYATVGSTGRIYFKHQSASGVSAEVYTTGAIPSNTWTKVIFSWSAPSSVGVKIGSAAEQLGSGTVTDFASTATLEIGNANSGMDDEYHFDNVEVGSGYAF